ncbi:MAG: hypothetical protein LBM16_05265 [Clostridiales bacterium]|nr:hypothetical protein [Clostridiales bacterium]
MQNSIHAFVVIDNRLKCHNFIFTHAGINAVVNGNQPDIVVGEKHLGVELNHGVIAPQTAQIPL